MGLQISSPPGLPTGLLACIFLQRAQRRFGRNPLGDHPLCRSGWGSTGADYHSGQHPTHHSVSKWVGRHLSISFPPGDLGLSSLADQAGWVSGFESLLAVGNQKPATCPGKLSVLVPVLLTLPQFGSHLDSQYTLETAHSVCRNQSCWEILSSAPQPVS